MIKEVQWLGQVMSQVRIKSVLAVARNIDDDSRRRSRIL